MAPPLLPPLPFGDPSSPNPTPFEQALRFSAEEPEATLVAREEADIRWAKKRSLEVTAPVEQEFDEEEIKLAIANSMLEPETPPLSHAEFEPESPPDSYVDDYEPWSPPPTPDAGSGYESL